MVSVVFTGLYRYDESITNMTLKERIYRLRDNGINDIYWYVWKGYTEKSLEDYGVNIVEIDEPFPHQKGIGGRQRQIYNVETALQDFSDDEVILKLRWDLDFNDALIKNVTQETYFDKIEDGLLDNKIWTGFYSIQELFSPADKAFAGYKRDLNKLINFQYEINGTSANNYISHDGMMLMSPLIEKNKEVSEFIKLNEPFPNGLMFQEEHYDSPGHLNAWAYSYYLLHRYFKTGPLGSCYFKRGDMSRWPFSFVDYNNFNYNYQTVIGKAPKMGLYPKYRVYDDIFVEKLVNGKYNDDFGQSLYKIISDNIEKWKSEGV